MEATIYPNIAQSFQSLLARFWASMTTSVSETIISHLLNLAKGIDMVLEDVTEL